MIFLFFIQKIYYICRPKKKGGGTTMLIIPIKEGENIDRALKRYKRKFDKTGTMRQLRSRQQFDKPSIENRAKQQKAQYIQRLRDQEEI